MLSSKFIKTDKNNLLSKAIIMRNWAENVIIATEVNANVGNVKWVGEWEWAMGMNIGKWEFVDSEHAAVMKKKR